MEESQRRVLEFEGTGSPSISRGYILLKINFTEVQLTYNNMYPLLHAPENTQLGQDMEHFHQTRMLPCAPLRQSYIPSPEPSPGSH